MIRLIDIAGALSVGTDLGNGQPAETAMRITRRALHIAAALPSSGGPGAVSPTTIVWAGLLRFAGCVSTSVEESSFGGDDLALRSALLGVDLTNPSDIGAHLGTRKYVPPGAGPIDVAAFAERGPQLAPVVLAAHCEIAVSLARRLGVHGDAVTAIAAYHERFDGRGAAGLRGDDVPLASRILAVAQGAELHIALDRAERRALLRARAGHFYDPRIVDVALRDDVDLPMRESPWPALVAVEDGAHRVLDDKELPEILRALGDWADLKSPCFTGHARAVARTVATVARSEGDDAALLSLAATVHDVGRVAVPNAIWDHGGVLDDAQRERARMHVMMSGTILARIPGLEDVRRLVATHHERLDGRGYPSAFDGTSLSRATRLLAAADVWVSMQQDRPHRPALSHEEAVRALRAEVDAGKLDARAVSAVLDAAGVTTKRGAAKLPAGLSDREAEVLALVARGLTNKEVGARLRLSPRTVQQHTIRIYKKLGVTTRAAAALFASEHELV